MYDVSKQTEKTFNKWFIYTLLIVVLCLEAAALELCLETLSHNALHTQWG